ncbi:glycosyltransferase [Dankookia sp. P2]|uniref:glycosyltransferase n=1 Tax=Dankookia sp. P2 TaxID=3423955 RepID=UPI003D66943C
MSRHDPRRFLTDKPAVSLQRALRIGWRAAWGLLPDGVLPFRIRLAGLARRLVGETPTRRYDPSNASSYAAWVARCDTLTTADRAAIRNHIDAMPRRPFISVVMPTYETPERLLTAAIASVRAQLWPHWELCIADDASPPRMWRAFWHPPQRRTTGSAGSGGHAMDTSRPRPTPPSAWRGATSSP